jgi:hypothetical protein
MEKDCYVVLSLNRTGGIHVSRCTSKSLEDFSNDLLQTRKIIILEEIPVSEWKIAYEAVLTFLDMYRKKGAHHYSSESCFTRETKNCAIEIMKKIIEDLEKKGPTSFHEKSDERSQESSIFEKDDVESDENESSDKELSDDEFSEEESDEPFEDSSSLDEPIEATHIDQPEEQPRPQLYQLQSDRNAYNKRCRSENDPEEPAPKRQRIDYNGYKCNICGKEVSHKSNKARHEKSAVHLRALTGEKKPTTFKCERCGLITKYKASLLRHIREKHGYSHREIKYKFNCVVCDLDIRDLNSAYEHILTKQHRKKLHAKRPDFIYKEMNGMHFDMIIEKETKK